MNKSKILKFIIAFAVIILAGYFYFLELKENWESIKEFEFSFNLNYLVASFLVFIFTYVLETYIWHVCIKKHDGRHQISFLESMVIVNSSGALKYLPGRIWTYTAQLLWLKKYDISKSATLYVNLICILGSSIVSLYLGLLYLGLYTQLFSFKALILMMSFLVLANSLYIFWHTQILTTVIRLASRCLKKAIQPLNLSKTLLLYVQFISACSWLLLGCSGYLLAKGVGLNIAYNQVFALLASMSLAWIVGYFAFMTPGGLGVREGMMLLMLNHIVNAHTSLIFPILSRIMYLVTEALLGLLALFLGIRFQIFSIGKRSHE